MAVDLFQNLTGRDAVEMACRQHPGVFAEQKMGFTNAPFHWEWYRLQAFFNRLCVVAPREHAKSEVFSVVSTAHMAIYRAGSWQAIFSQTQEQGKKVLERVLVAVGQTAPYLLDNIPKFTSTEVILSNMSRITIAGAGAAVRGWHPDRIVGDDVLNDASGTSSLWRRKMETWWFGTVGPMAHPGTKRQLGWGMRGTTNLGYRVYAPTKIVLVGTPFHQLDLLMQMRENPLYRFMRYDAEYDPDELVDGTYAVEVA